MRYSSYFNLIIGLILVIQISYDYYNGTINGSSLISSFVAGINICYFITDKFFYGGKIKSNSIRESKK